MNECHSVALFFFALLRWCETVVGSSCQHNVQVYNAFWKTTFITLKELNTLPYAVGSS